MQSKTRLIASGLAIALAAAVQCGCAGTTTVTGPAGQPEMTKIEPEQPVLQGKVVETMTAGGYTYILLEKDGKKGWSAVPAMEVKVGQEMALQPGADMGPFRSKSLDKSFEHIIFSGGLAEKPTEQSAGGSAGMPAGHPPMKPASPTAAPLPGANTTNSPALAGKVVETMNAGTYTYICLEKDGVKSWFAVPSEKVAIGDEIEIRPGTSMGSFTSKTLNRTFDEIMFSPGIKQKK